MKCNLYLQQKNPMTTKRFKKIYIEITNVCNLNCSFCPPTKRKPEFMSIDTFGKILNQIKPYTDYIYLHVKGEPLLHPDLSAILDISYEKGFFVNITTNGTLIPEIKDTLFAKPAIRQINISLHSMENNNTDNTYIKNILTYIKQAVSDTSMIISLRLWNLDDKDSFSFGAGKNSAVLQAIENAFNLPFRIEEASATDRGIKIADRIYVNQDFVFEWPDINAKEINTSGFCYGLRNHVAILVDGTVVPCCLDQDGIMNLGNISETDFSKIIGSKRAIDIVNGFNNRQITEELCKKCPYISRFDIKSH